MSLSDKNIFRIFNFSRFDFLKTRYLGNTVIKPIEVTADYTVAHASLSLKVDFTKNNLMTYLEIKYGR